jgi:hypothetical protein
MLSARSRQHLFQLFFVVSGVDPARRQEGQAMLSCSPSQHLFSTFSLSPVRTLPGGRRGKLDFRVSRVNTFFNFFFVASGIDPARRQEGQAKCFASPRQHLFTTFFQVGQ